MKSIAPSLGWCSGTMTWTSGWSETKSSIGFQTSITNEEKYLRVYYTQTDNHTGEKKDFDYRIPITTTPCRYGGERYWFICPLSTNGRYCGRRVGTLYKAGNYFGCRHCHRITYASRNASDRYKGFVSCPDIEKQEEKVKRTHYAGKPTKQYRKLLKMEERFNWGIIRATGNLEALKKKYGV